MIPSSMRVLLLSGKGSFVGKKRKKVWNAVPLCIFLDSMEGTKSKSF